MDNFTDTAVFVRVAELGSFTRAADALGFSKAAVSKSVSRLEQRLGARLLHRTTRRITLTEAGEALFRRSAAALSELAEAEDEVGQLSGKPRGLLRISAPTYLGTVTLAPLLREYRSRYPEVSIDLELDDRIVDLVQERFDVAVRISNMGDSSMVSRRLGPCPLVVVGSPAYVRKHGMPKTPAELAEYDCLTYSVARMPNEWRLRPVRGRWVDIAVSGTIRCNSDFVLKQAALDGLGLGLFPLFFVERELNEGRLINVTRNFEAPTLDIQIVYASRRHVPAKVRSFVDFLAERLGGR